jgi:hypothetical protein
VGHQKFYSLKDCFYLPCRIQISWRSSQRASAIISETKSKFTRPLKAIILRRQHLKTEGETSSAGVCLHLASVQVARDNDAASIRANDEAHSNPNIMLHWCGVGNNFGTHPRKNWWVRLRLREMSLGFYSWNLHFKLHLTRRRVCADKCL